MIDEIQQAERAAVARLAAVDAVDGLASIENDLVGKRSELGTLKSRLGGLDEEGRRAAGQDRASSGRMMAWRRMPQAMGMRQWGETKAACMGWAERRMRRRASWPRAMGRRRAAAPTSQARVSHLVSVTWVYQAGGAGSGVRGARGGAGMEDAPGNEQGRGRGVTEPMVTSPQDRLARGRVVPLASRVASRARPCASRVRTGHLGNGQTGDMGNGCAPVERGGPPACAFAADAGAEKRPCCATASRVGANRSIHVWPNARRAATRLCARQSNLRLSAVDAPPSALGWT
jgi:hypothetical protein